MKPDRYAFVSPEVPTRHLAEAVRDVAWNAQARLTNRYRSLIAKRRRATVPVTAAAARDPVGFMWAIAVIEPTVACGASIKLRRLRQSG